jgi:hypothetical protein
MIKISADMDGFNKSLETVSNKLDQASKKFTDVGKTLSFSLTAPIVALAGGTIKLASDFEETLNKINVSFGDNAEEIIKWSKTSIQSMGMAQASALEATALFGDFATGMGLTKEEATGMSMNLTQLGADLSSFKNIPVEQAMTALKGVFTGETESLKGLGVVMTQTNLDAFALSQGIQENVSDMTESEKINLRYAFVMNASKNAQGDFARTSQGSANQMRIFKETLVELGTQFGTVLLPLFTEIINKVNQFVSSFMDLDLKTQQIILVVAGVVAGIGPFLIILGQLIKVFALLSNPIGLIVLAISLITAGIIYLYKTNEDFANFVLQVWDKIQKAFEFLSKIFVQVINGDIKSSIDTFLKMIFGMSFETDKTITTITNIFLTFKEIFNAIIQEIKAIIENIFLPYLQRIIETFKMIVDAVKPILTDLLEFIGIVFSKIVTFWNENGAQLVTAIFNIVNFILGIFKFFSDTIISIVQFFLPFIISQFRVAFLFIQDIFKNVLDIVLGIFKIFIGVFTGDWKKVWEGVKDIFSGIIGAIVSVFKGMINSIISTINFFLSKVNKISIKIPSVKIPFVGEIGGFEIALPNIPTIPFLAEGGIVTAPTLAMIGEDRNPEMVIPLNKISGLINSNQTNIYLDGRELTKAIAPRMVDMIRARGVTT